MNQEKIILTAEQAIGLLSDDSEIHTFRSGTSILLGADWSRDELIKSFHAAGSEDIQIGGDACKSMGHGLVLFTGDDPLFIEVDKEKLQKLEDEVLGLN